MSEFGKYGAYIWSAILLTLLTLSLHGISSLLSYRALKKDTINKPKTPYTRSED